MHELSLLLNIVSMVEGDAAKRGINIVSNVRLQVGELSGASPYALEAAFPIAVKGTILEGAELTIDKVPATVLCKRCGQKFEPLQSKWICPKCGSADSTLRSGRELQVISYSGEAS